MRTKVEELQYINTLQDKYVDELIACIDSNENSILKETNLTSPTGTGKTQMIAKLINKRPDWFFLITTLSHGQLHKQVEAVVKRLCPGNNYKIFGVSSFTKTSILTGNDILRLLPADKKVVWLRDEGHRNTNNWSALLEDRCDKIVNVSATNKEQEGVVCNFSDTMMLRTVAQREGDFRDAIDTFLDIKKAHAKIAGYTPCILFRVVTKKASEEIIAELQQRGIRYINLVGYDEYDMRELCQDSCRVEAIIYMQKMDVGIDIRRAHVIWLQTTPSNITTTIQCVGRCRRNALFWRDDVDILAPENHWLLEKTRVCHAFYKMEGAIVDTDEYGELVNAFCPYISIQKLRANIFVNVEDGTMQNGLKIVELEGCTGTFEVTKDLVTGFNVVNNNAFYHDEIQECPNHLTDPRLDILFTPSERLVSAISNIAKNLSDNPYPCIAFGFGRVPGPHTTSEQTVGFYKYEYIYEMWDFDATPVDATPVLHVYNTVVYESESQFWADVTKHYKNRKSPQIYGLEPYTRGPGSTPLTTSFSSILNALKICANMCNPSGQKWPVTVSDDLWRSVILPFIYPETNKRRPMEFAFYIAKKITATTPVLRFTYSIGHRKGSFSYLYTFEECQKVAQNKTICPDKPQYFTATTNCRELAIIGPEKHQLIEKNWTPMVSVTSLISSDTKFRRFLYQRYPSIIAATKPYLYKQKQTIDFEDRRQNSCLGYCVEYYSKGLLYKDYLTKELAIIKRTEKFTDNEDVIMVRACLDKYRAMMIQTFGNGVARTLRFPTLETLGRDEYQKFIETCKALGTQTKARAQEILGCPAEIDQEYSTSLPTRHLRGLMDIVSYDTIIDIKVTGEISEKMILQVLAYYYLSQYRSDLAIDRVVIYDAVYDRYLAISGLRNGNLQITANYLPGRAGLVQTSASSSAAAPAASPTRKPATRNQPTPKPCQQKASPPVAAPGSTELSSSPKAINIAVGDSVVHQKFGKGTVTSVKKGTIMTLVSIKFSDCGEKVLSYQDAFLKGFAKKVSPP